MGSFVQEKTLMKPGKVVVLAALLASSCYEPAIEDGQYSCTVGGCPSGFVCTHCKRCVGEGGNVADDTLCSEHDLAFTFNDDGGAQLDGAGAVDAPDLADALDMRNPDDMAKPPSDLSGCWCVWAGNGCACTLAGAGGKPWEGCSSATCPFALIPDSGGAGCGPNEPRPGVGCTP
jgi:hypothetical protein